DHERTASHLLRRGTRTLALHAPRAGNQRRFADAAAGLFFCDDHGERGPSGGTDSGYEVSLSSAENQEKRKSGSGAGGSASPRGESRHGALGLRPTAGSFLRQLRCKQSRLAEETL